MVASPPETRSCVWPTRVQTPSPSWAERGEGGAIDGGGNSTFGHAGSGGGGGSFCGAELDATGVSVDVAIGTGAEEGDAVGTAAGAEEGAVAGAGLQAQRIATAVHGSV
jgi:hypothetical protein